MRNIIQAKRKIQKTESEWEGTLRGEVLSQALFHCFPDFGFWWGISLALRMGKVITSRTRRVLGQSHHGKAF
jgi:hypothetical protein